MILANNKGHSRIIMYLFQSARIWLRCLQKIIKLFSQQQCCKNYSTSSTDENIEKVKEIVLDNCHSSLRECEVTLTSLTSLFDFGSYFGHETRRHMGCSKRAKFSSKYGSTGLTCKRVNSH